MGEYLPCARSNIGAEIAIRQKQYLLKKVSKEGQRTFDKQHITKIRRNCYCSA